MEWCELHLLERRSEDLESRQHEEAGGKPRGEKVTILPVQYSLVNYHMHTAICLSVAQPELQSNWSCDTKSNRP